MVKSEGACAPGRLPKMTPIIILYMLGGGFGGSAEAPSDVLALYCAIYMHGNNCCI